MEHKHRDHFETFRTRILQNIHISTTIVSLLPVFKKIKQR